MAVVVTTTRITVAVTTTSRSERRRRLLAAALSAWVVAGCSSCEDQSGGAAPSASAAADLAPVPEPDGLAAEVLVPKPEATYAELRAIAGTSAALLPKSFPLLAVTLLGLPPITADAIDGTLPATAAVGESVKQGLAPVLALRVRSGPDLMARLTTGAEAPFGVEAHAASGVAVLIPKPGKASGDITLGVVGNTLLAAREQEDLVRYGPFAARTLPKRPMPPESITVTANKKALAGPIAKLVRSRWEATKKDLEAADRDNRQKHGGRAPDFGDPAVAVAGISGSIERFLAVLGSTESARLTLVARDGALDVRVDATPAPGGAARELASSFVVGDAKPLLALPKGAALLVLTRSDAAGRKESAQSMASGLGRLLGDRMTEADRKKVEDALTRLAAGRGDWATYGVAPMAGALVHRGAVSDAKAFDSGLKATVALANLRAFKEPLRQYVGDFTLTQSRATIVGFDAVERSLFTIKPSPMRGAAQPKEADLTPRPLELLWTHKDGVTHAVLGSDAVPVLGPLVAPESPEATWASLPKARQLVERAGADVSFAVMVQPLALGVGRSVVGSSASPMLLSIGQKSGRPFLRLDADGPAVQALISAAIAR